jgi:hypothetical protein
MGIEVLKMSFSDLKGAGWRKLQEIKQKMDKEREEKKLLDQVYKTRYNEELEKKRREQAHVMAEKNAALQARREMQNRYTRRPGGSVMGSLSSGLKAVRREAAQMPIAKMYYRPMGSRIRTSPYSMGAMRHDVTKHHKQRYVVIKGKAVPVRSHHTKKRYRPNPFNMLWP